MFKVTFFLLALNIILVNCSPTGVGWQQTQHPIEYPTNAHHPQVVEKPKDAITTSVITEENVMTVQKPHVNPVNYLPTFIQGLLPQVITQAIGQLAAYLPGFQRTGLYPQQQLGLGYPSYVSVSPGLPINIPQVYLPGQVGILPHQAGIMQQQVGVWPYHAGLLPHQGGLLPYGLYR